MSNRLRVFLGLEHAKDALSLTKHSLQQARAILSRGYVPADDRQAPKTGDQRIITRFAWLPIRTLDGDRRWLQIVYIRQIYLTSMRKFGFGSVWTTRWANGEFVDSVQN